MFAGALCDTAASVIAQLAVWPGKRADKQVMQKAPWLAGLRVFRSQRNFHPARRLVKFHRVHLLDVVKCGACAHRNICRRVGLVKLVVCVYFYLLDPRLLVELDVYQVRLRPI